jgi:FkbM family methyltransferase
MIIGRIFKKEFKPIYKYNSFLNRAHSFSQYGEDSILKLMINLYDIKNPTYIDIGAFHPFKYSNTALLYNSGLRGINIEPDPVLFRNFLKFRVKDINLNIGLHNLKTEMIFHKFERPEFNTFSLNSAKEIEMKGVKKICEILVKVDTYNNIIIENFSNKAPDILFIDTEGLDEIILESIDYKQFAPQIICAETYAYGLGTKNFKLIDLLLMKGYKIHADTFVNTIFINKSIL